MTNGSSGDARASKNNWVVIFQGWRESRGSAASRESGAKFQKTSLQLIPPFSPINSSIRLLTSRMQHFLTQAAFLAKQQRRLTCTASKDMFGRGGHVMNALRSMLPLELHIKHCLLPTCILFHLKVVWVFVGKVPNRMI